MDETIADNDIVNRTSYTKADGRPARRRGGDFEAGNVNSALQTTQAKASDVTKRLDQGDDASIRLTVDWFEEGANSYNPLTLITTQLSIAAGNTITVAGAPAFSYTRRVSKQGSAQRTVRI